METPPPRKSWPMDLIRAKENRQPSACIMEDHIRAILYKGGYIGEYIPYIVYIMAPL